MRIVYEVIERTTDKNGQFLLVPDIECNTIWTNLGWSDDDIINGYHDHGECEQFHSEIKTDMDVERFPSGKFDTNELVLELTVLAYNILRLIGQESLKSKRAPKKTSCQKKTYQNRYRESDSNRRTCNNSWVTDCLGNWLQ